MSTDPVDVDACVATIERLRGLGWSLDLLRFAASGVSSFAARHQELGNLYLAVRPDGSHKFYRSLAEDNHV